MKKSKKSRPQSRKPERSHRSKQKPRPRNEGTFTPLGRLVVGIHAVKEAVKVRPQNISELWIREKYSDNQALNELAAFATAQNVRIVTKAVGALDKIIPTHQGIAAYVTEDPEFDFSKAETLRFSTMIVLDGVEDPHNLGAVLRTAWLLGAHAVLIPEVRATGLSPAVTKVAQGAVEHVPVVAESSLVTTIEDLKNKGYWVLGLSHEAQQSLYDTKVPDKVVWILGSESHGIRKPLERLCDNLISVPQADPEASYNVSVAAALALGETFRQRTSFAP